MEALDQFKQFLQQRGLKFTRERDRIFQAIVDFEKPFDVDGLLFHLKQHEVKTSKATIYRTLQLLLESGIAADHQPVALGSSQQFIQFMRKISRLRSFGLHRLR